MVRFSYRLGQLEARLTDAHLMSYVEGKDYTVDICQWAEDNDHQWSIAYFNRSSDGWDLKFVGNRPLKLDTTQWLDFKRVVTEGLLFLERT